MSWLIIILVVLVVFYLIFQVIVARSKKRWSSADLKFFSSNWQRIEQTMDRRHQIMDADKLLDAMLKRKGYQGTVGEKLKKYGAVFTDINSVWSAHKLRNKLAHELDYRPSDKEMKTALANFSRAFRDLGL